MSEELGLLLRGSEGQLLEFKRQWHDVGSRKGKAEFARDVVAMANGLSEGQVGRIVFGRDDEEAGGGFVGVLESPTQDQLTELLGAAVRPVPSIRLVSGVPIEGVTVDVLEIRWHRHHPHYINRNYEGVLARDRVLVREGATTRSLDPWELEVLIRAKDARLGGLIAAGPLESGFVQLPSSGSRDATVRVRNVSDFPMESLTIIVDVVRAMPPRSLDRLRFGSGVTLHPGEEFAVDFRPAASRFYHANGDSLDDDRRVWSRWFDLTLRVQYRGRDGLLHEETQQVSTAG